MAVSRDGSQLAVAYRPIYTEDIHTIRVFDWKTGAILRTFHGHVMGIGAMSFSPDGKTLASGSQDTTILLWNLDKK